MAFTPRLPSFLPSLAIQKYLLSTPIIRFGSTSIKFHPQILATRNGKEKRDPYSLLSKYYRRASEFPTSLKLVDAA